jgi:hypothetical protein
MIFKSIILKQKLKIRVSIGLSCSSTLFVIALIKLNMRKILIENNKFVFNLAPRSSGICLLCFIFVDFCIFRIR